MNRKPDIIRTIALIFVVGLVITGFTSLRAPDSNNSASVSAYVSEAASASESNRN